MKNAGVCVAVTFLYLIYTILFFTSGYGTSVIYAVGMALSGGFGRTNVYNHQADDVISKTVYETMGSDDIYYQGREIYSDDICCYEYYLAHEKKLEMYRLINIVNTVIEEEDIHDKIQIRFIMGDTGVLCTVASFRNYSDASLSQPDYDSLQYLFISGGPDYNHIYHNARTYIDFKDIRYLGVSEAIQRNAEAQGIDWYEIWPDLEKAEVTPHGGESYPIERKQSGEQVEAPAGSGI